MLLVLWVLGLFSVSNAVPVDNGVEGEPEIECGPTSMSVMINTLNGFEGNIYVKNRFNEEGCRQVGEGRQTATIELGFDECGTRRIRTLNPKGVFVTANIVISFHPLFLTKVDRAYRIQCFYMEADKTVDTDLVVSMLTTDFQTQVVPMPICRYEILDGGPTGDIVQFALIGQQIYHKWTCDTETIDTFCMIVRDCFVDDTNGDTVDLVDQSGCAADLFLLNNPEYPSDLMAGVEAHVFKYADREDLYFQCQITILVKEPGQACPKPVCQTPPGRGAGAANPQPGPAQVDTDHPYPLRPGSPYLPGGYSGPVNGGAGAPPPPPDAFGPIGAFVDPRGRKKRAADYQEAGTVDVAAAFASLGVEERQAGAKEGERLRSLLHPALSSDEVCISPPIFYSFALVAGFAILAFALLSTKLYFNGK